MKDPLHLLSVPAWWNEPTPQEWRRRNRRLKDWLAAVTVAAVLGWLLVIVLFHLATR